ncbi:MAG: haloacid dehalogenase [Armatimonadetes bacterium]|nr:haloacid dehalogenase [Armatimonadota bacterium]
MDQLRAIAEKLRQTLEDKNTVREQALKLSREAIRCSANSIRATHRSQWDEAETLLAESRRRVRECQELLQDHQDIYYAGYTQDAQKEYAEAELAMAIMRGNPLKSAEELEVEAAPYLNALGEAIGETRRHVLDVMRKGDLARAEKLLDIMDEAYYTLVTFDYPDAITNGLRRTTDMVRGVLERTRSDLTVSMQQRELEKTIAEAVSKLER